MRVCVFLAGGGGGGGGRGDGDNCICHDVCATTPNTLLWSTVWDVIFKPILTLECEDLPIG